MYEREVAKEEWGLIEAYFQSTDNRGVIPKHGKRVFVVALVETTLMLKPYVSIG